MAGINRATAGEINALGSHSDEPFRKYKHVSCGPVTSRGDH